MFFIGIWGVAAYTFHASAKTLAFVMAGNSIASIIGSVAAGLLVDKFAYHLPLYRQHQRLQDSGIDVSRPDAQQVRGFFEACQFIGWNEG